MDESIAGQRLLPAGATVAVVGAGFPGLGMAAALDRAGIHDYVLLERAQGVGGTWRDNTYQRLVPRHMQGERRGRLLADP